MMLARQQNYHRGRRGFHGAFGLAINTDFECHPSALSSEAGEVMCSPLDNDADGQFHALQQAINNASAALGVSGKLVTDGIVGPATTRQAIAVLQAAVSKGTTIQPSPTDIPNLQGCSSPSGVCPGELVNAVGYYTSLFQQLAGGTVAAANPPKAGTGGPKNAAGFPTQEQGLGGPSAALIAGIAIGALALVGSTVAAVAYRRRQSRRRSRKAYAY